SENPPSSQLSRRLEIHEPFLCRAGRPGAVQEFATARGCNFTSRSDVCQRGQAIHVFRSTKGRMHRDEMAAPRAREWIGAAQVFALPDQARHVHSLTEECASAITRRFGQRKAKIYS